MWLSVSAASCYPPMDPLWRWIEFLATHDVFRGGNEAEEGVRKIGPERVDAVVGLFPKL